MNEAPAASIDLTRKPYHHNVPLLSLSRSGCRWPIQITGIVAKTGTKMMTRCKNLTPVHSGSQMYLSMKMYMHLRTFFEFCSPFGNCSLSSFLEASSISSSLVFSLSPSSSCFSLISTNASGLSVAPARNIMRPFGRRKLDSRCRTDRDREHVVVAEKGRGKRLGA
jgi:hypothetical protein